ncbi:DoxX family protein [Mucilaginibacter sp. FT3.2]|uniref:DoxX family protein n=1 Tax=Mucilaginibacter sp. FT3.2 TaxID=2723090 RepID=UPI0016170146|nr:DoxX family protein [Mucilaginibacter sp. FT3.2]MBB6230519.1 putative membrane protein YphA (DoxX/SURF4 family) [Mucilaginibacter sp. FT3.2]
MKIAIIIVRTLIGLMFLFASVSWFAMVFFHAFPMPPVTGNMKVFNEGIAASGYLMMLVKITELVCALLLLFGRYVALALVVLFPIMVNIVSVNAFLAPSGLTTVIPLLIGILFLAYTQREKYAALFTAK